jgi:phosphonopyruvate decarboxylase
LIRPQEYLQLLKSYEIDWFTGVPDSLLSPLCSHIFATVDDDRHVLAANEGNAVGLAAGHFLASGKPGMVYLQNSGLGNTINPLLSLADQAVYNVPMLLVVGWRGEPGAKADEPQHVSQGEKTLALLDACGIEYIVVRPSQEEESVLSECKNLLDRMAKTQAPVAIVVSSGTFVSGDVSYPDDTSLELTREDAIGHLLETLGTDDVIVSTTGMASRELFELREKRGEGHQQDFLTVGSMGHSSQIALAIALEHPDRQIVCLDGDGAMLMHMGGLAAIGTKSPANFMHVVINNRAHDSVGGQPTSFGGDSLAAIALSCGYADVATVDTATALRDSIERFKISVGPTMIEVQVRRGNRSDLGRPTVSPLQNRTDFMANLGIS